MDKFIPFVFTLLYSCIGNPDKSIVGPWIKTLFEFLILQLIVVIVLFPARVPLLFLSWIGNFVGKVCFVVPWII